MVKLIGNDAEYKIALKRISKLMDQDLAANTESSDEFDVLALLVEHYEKIHYPVPPPQPLEAIKFRMEQSGIGEEEFRKLTGLKHGKELFSGKYKLTLSMIRKLHDKLHIPAEILIQPY